MEIAKKNFKYVALFPICFLFMLVVSPSTSPLSTYCSTDAAIFMTVGKGWLAGLIPYKDMFDHKGPFLFFIQAIGLLINNKIGILALQSLWLAVDLYLIVKIVELYRKTKTAIIAVVIFLLLFTATACYGNLSEEWSLPFMFMPMYISLNFCKQELPTKKHPYGYSLFYGMCFGALIMMRINNSAILCGLFLAFGILLIRERAWKELFINICCVLVGACIVVGPFVLYFIWNQAFDEFFYANITFNLAYASSTSKKTVKMVMSGIAKSLPAILLICIAFKSKWSQKTVLAICMALASTANLFLSMAYEHYYVLYLPTIVLLLALLETDRFSITKNVILFLVLVLPYATLFIPSVARIMVIDFNDAARKIIVEMPTSVQRLLGYNEKGLGSVWFSNERKQSVEEIMTYIPSEEQGNVWLYDVDPEAYIYADIVPNYKYFILQSFQSSFDARIEKETNAYLLEKTPQFILTPTVQNKNSLISDLLSDRYTEIAKVDYGMHLTLYVSGQ